MKKGIVRTIQLMIVSVLCGFGIYFGLLFAWFIIGLPANQWTLIGIGILSITLNTYLMIWIENTDEQDKPQK